jgi:hypothetical protein
MKPTYLDTAQMNLCQECLRITQGEPIRTPLLGQIPGERAKNVAKAIRFICALPPSSRWDWETPCELCHLPNSVEVTTQQASSGECSLHANAISKDVAVSLMSPLLTDDERSRLVSFLYWLNYHAVGHWADAPLHSWHSPEVTHPTISD